MTWVEIFLLAAVRHTMSIAGEGTGVSINDGLRAKRFGTWLLAQNHPGHKDWCNLNSPMTLAPTWCSCEPAEPAFVRSYQCHGYAVPVGCSCPECGVCAPL